MEHDDGTEIESHFSLCGRGRRLKMAERRQQRQFKMKVRLYFKTLLFVVVLVGFTCYNIASDVAAKFEWHGRALNEGGCTPPADPPVLALAYSVGILYLFLGLAILADELFCPTLDVIADWMHLPSDVAGATLQAAGGSSPELFTSAVGTFLRSDVGFGAIVGSAVFNVLFVVGCCVVLTPNAMKLNWYPLLRDSSYYCLVLTVLAIFFGVNTPNEVDWYVLPLLERGVVPVYPHRVSPPSPPPPIVRGASIGTRHSSSTGCTTCTSS
jgi:sodium/potassium/calcium exchanger 2